MCDSCKNSRSSSDSDSDGSDDQYCSSSGCDRGGRYGCRPSGKAGSSGSCSGNGKSSGSRVGVLKSRNGGNYGRSGSIDNGFNFFPLGNTCSDGTCARPKNGSLPFDPSAIQEIILKLIDVFDLRVNMTSGQMTKAVVLTSGLALAGSLVGKTVGGKMGAAIGGAVGGACGVGITLVSLRDVWEEVWWKLSELYDITYDFLGGLGFADYQSALMFLLQDKNKGAHLANILAQVASSVLGKTVVSSVMSSCLNN